VATLPEKSFQGQPLLEKNNQVQKIQIILGKKFLLPSSDLTRKKLFASTSNLNQNHQLIKT